jgi:hypothetical protein
VKFCLNERHLDDGRDCGSNTDFKEAIEVMVNEFLSLQEVLHKLGKAGLMAKERQDVVESKKIRVANICHAQEAEFRKKLERDNSG